MFTNISRTYCTDIYSQSETFVYTNLPVPYLRNLTLYLNVITLCRLPIYLMIDLIFKFDKFFLDRHYRTAFLNLFFEIALTYKGSLVIFLHISVSEYSMITTIFLDVYVGNYIFRADLS